jgi:hypothetical protein
VNDKGRILVYSRDGELSRQFGLMGKGPGVGCLRRSDRSSCTGAGLLATVLDEAGFVSLARRGDLRAATRRRWRFLHRCETVSSRQRKEDFVITDISPSGQTYSARLNVAS